MTRETDEDIYEIIYKVVRLIPAGRVSTYGHIAAAIGLKSGARLVGYAMNHCHQALPLVPAWRVLNRKGVLTGRGHFGPGDEMASLLRAEGIRVANDCVENFDQLLWDPAIEL